MKSPITYFAIVLYLSFCGVNMVTAQELRKVDNEVFQRGEVTKYRVYYDSWLTSGLTAGTGTISVLEDNKKFHGRDTYHVVVNARSVGLFNLFFKVRDRFESFIDEEAIIPWSFIRRTREGSYRKNEDIFFNQFENYAESQKKIISVPPNVQDIISAFYYMRTIDFSDAEVNDEYTIEFLLDDSVYISRIIYLGKEVVETRLGRFRCLKFKPMVAQGEVFDEPYPMILWVSDDKNRVPILGSSAVIIGSIKLELIKIEGLRHPMKARLD